MSASRTVVITGCSSGFGRSLAERLARDGDRVYATMRGCDDRNREAASELEVLASAEGLDLRVLDLDVTSDASVASGAERVVDESGAPDVVVNNAGQMYVGVTEAYTPDEVARQLDVNVVGIHRVCRAFLPGMRERGEGLIINLSSIAGRIGLPFFAVYHASKWGVEGYSAGLRREVASSGIDVVVVEPGPFTTQLFPRAPAPEDAEGRADTYPSGVHRTFEEMAAAFEGLFEDPDAPTDPDLVVDRMIELIRMPAGERPLRSVVGVDFGVEERNRSDAPHDVSLLETLGLSEFATLRPRSAESAAEAD